MDRTVLLLALAVFPAAASAAGDRAAFLEEKRDIVALVVERVRAAPDDVQRALKAGEEDLRRLHGDFQVAKSTPPTRLDADVAEMTSAATRMRLERSRGKTPAADPRAEAAVARRWRAYRARVEALFQDIQYKRDSAVSESSIYWSAVNDLDVLAEGVAEALAYNAPPGERSVEDAVARDHWDLLKRLEDPARVRGLSSCVVGPGEEGSIHAFDAAPFYRAAGVLPGENPLDKGAFTVPPGCRTATRREPGRKLVLRPVRGKGTLRIGATSRPLAYDYAVVPPEAPWIVENPGKDALDVEFISLMP